MTENHISNLFNLKIQGHQDINFVDVNTQKDTKLFLDPSLIEELPFQFCNKMSVIIESFFKEVFVACKNKNHSILYNLSRHGGEPNEVFLGMSTGKVRGKGNSAESLSSVFNGIASREYVKLGLIKQPSDILIFIPEFAEDRMSDLLTNLLRQELNNFSLEQAKLWNIPVSKEKVYIGKFWNETTLKWDKLNDYAILVNDKPILLVPKQILVKRNVVSAESFLQKQVLKTRQNFHLDNATSLTHKKIDKSGNVKLVPPSKKVVRETEVGNIPIKEYLENYSKDNLDDIRKFRKHCIAKTRILEYCLTDYELDNIVYIKNINIA